MLQQSGLPLRLLASLARIAFLLYLSLVVIGCFLSDRLIFQPHPSSYRDTSELLKLTTENGNRITAIYLSNPGAKFTLLISHGNAEDLGDDREWYEQLRSAGFNVIAYDYEGYGTSEGAPSEKHAYQDEMAVYSYLLTTAKTPADRVILLGRSVGSGPAVYLAAQRRVAGLILQSPFTSAFRVLTRVPILPFDRFPNYKDIGSVHCPVLIIHGTNDSVIGIWHAKELYELANEPKSYLWVRGADHNDLEDVAGKTYLEKIQTFAASIVVPRGEAGDC
jgi:fermentation-respiration switch protein FrsA (DUF1100 family)